MKTCLLVLGLTLLPQAQPAPAKRIDLTGQPAATIENAFTRVTGVREISSSLVVVTDQMDKAVFVADFSKRAATKIGRQGRGPAEYQFPTAPLAGPNGTTWIVDASLARALVISPDGKIASTIALPSASLGSARASDARGRVYFQGSDFNPESGRFSDTVPLVRWDPVSDRTDTVARVWSGGRVILNRKSGRASLAREITPFAHLDAWAPLSDGRLAIIRHDPFQIDVVSLTGAITRGNPIVQTPIAITAAEREAYRARTTTPRVGAAMVGGGTGPTGPGTQFEDGDFPPTMPPFIASAVRSTPDGEIWIGRSHTAAAKTWTYDIFDGAGRPLGTALLRANSTVVGFGPKSVYVARVNPDDDLVYLERFAR